MNRKHVTYSDYYELDGMIYEINTTIQSGCYTPILKSGISQLNICYDKWKRVFVYFFALHDHIQREDSKHVSNFIDKKLKPYLEKNYDMKQVGYLWVREQEKAKSQHYHFVLYLDGDKIQHPRILSKALKDLWENGSNDDKTIGYVKNSFYDVRGIEELHRAVTRLSYLAKERGKGYRPPQSKDFGRSRLTN